MEPRAQYTRTRDGVSIAFWSIGGGAPLVLMPSMPVSHIEYEWQIPEWRAWYESLAERRRVVRYDGRGAGLSDRRATGYSLDTLAADLEAVVDRLDLESFALLAAYHAGPAAIKYAAEHVERVSHLLLWCSFSRGAELDSPEIRATRSLIGKDWEVYTQTAAHVLLGWRSGEAAQSLARLIEQGNSPEGFLALLDASDKFDATPYLDDVRAPTIVMHRRGISWLSQDLARSLAACIPDARLAMFDGDSIAPYLGDASAVTETILDFLGEPLATRPLDTSLKTILFTDIEGHTAIMRRLGDVKGREVLRDHERLTREALHAHGGSEVKTMGDGFMASFNSTQAAVQCAIALQRAFRTYNAQGGVELKVRVGLNAGEPIAEQGDLFGTAVILAARCAAEARGGEIMATDVVRQLAEGRGIRFADRGMFNLRGFEEPARLFEVGWTE